ncbi:hypothetical protein M3611_26565 [Priestia megaterium]|uniref:hypothetical protein n=1 Tax=Priestia megaterium TaxID=1404 RepID=UPI00203B9F06|nr:hypothetical protein [Priestia megaterium]MCM3155560.1 hypothetical protein [Priestia megaterium]
MTAPNPVTTLTKKWFEIEGIPQDRRAFGFIGKMYKQYGEETVLQAFDAIKSRPTQAKDIKRPQEYLRGICKKIGVSESAVNKEGRSQFEDMMKNMFS